MSELMLSVAVITYNQAKFISQTLDSILSQQHSYSYEIIVGDDCSTDNTRAVISEYVKKYPEIIKPLYNEKNFGLIENYFNVIKHCSGKYIMECAGDDWWLPGKVAKQIELMEKNNDIAMCYGKAYVWSEAQNKILPHVIGDGDNTFNSLIISNYITALTVCFTKEAILEYIKDVNPVKQNWLMEDFPFWLWISKNKKMHQLKDVLGCYRVTNTSISHVTNVEKKIKFLESVKAIKEYYCEDKELLKIFNNSFYEDSAFEYLKNGDLRNYRKFVRKSNSYKAIIKFICSFLPFYTSIILKKNKQ